ncbi:DUF6233 domain-containing protein [Streptomyces sp. NPDC005989]|uniref:DUF6233 domain-containing protein n=1 Tax=Streptomyces sp. NPDC005989 TaxID=3156727 RepID=UPI0033F0354B
MRNPGHPPRIGSSSSASGSARRRARCTSATATPRASRRVIDRDQARALLADGICACAHCRPDTGLGVFRIPSGALPLSRRRFLSCGLCVGDLLPWRHLADCGAPVITLGSPLGRLLPSAAVTTQRRAI